MPFGTGPFGVTPMVFDEVLATSDRGWLVSSREIGPNGTFNQRGDGTGSFKGMGDVASQIYGLIATRVVEPEKITANYATDIRAKILEALRPVTDGRQPRARIEEILVEDSGSITQKRVRFVDLTNGEAGEVKL